MVVLIKNVLLTPHGTHVVYIHGSIVFSWEHIYSNIQSGLCTPTKSGSFEKKKCSFYLSGTVEWYRLVWKYMGRDI
jgi:hypothetical protein